MVGGSWLLDIGRLLLLIQTSIKLSRGREEAKKEGRGHAQDFPNRFRKSFLLSFFPHPVTPMAALWMERGESWLWSCSHSQFNIYFLLLSSFPPSLWENQFSKRRSRKGEKMFFSPNESSRRGRQIFFSRSPKEFFEFMKNRKWKTIDLQNGRFRVTNRAALIYFCFLPFLSFFSSRWDRRDKTSIFHEDEWSTTLHFPKNICGGGGSKKKLFSFSRIPKVEKKEGTLFFSPPSLSQYYFLSPHVGNLTHTQEFSSRLAYPAFPHSVKRDGKIAKLIFFLLPLLPLSPSSPSSLPNPVFKRAKGDNFTPHSTQPSFPRYIHTCMYKEDRKIAQETSPQDVRKNFASSLLHFFTQ